MSDGRTGMMRKEHCFPIYLYIYILKTIYFLGIWIFLSLYYTYRIIPKISKSYTEKPMLTIVYSPTGLLSTTFM